MRSIVLPGEMISASPLRIENSYIENGKTYSNIMGMYEPNSRGIIPLEGSWSPNNEDTVVGIIIEPKGKVYIVDLQFFGRCLLIPGKFDDYEFTPGEVIEARIKEVENRKTIILGEAKLLEGGKIIHVRPKKVLRVIGKKNTMIDQIKQLTKTDIVVGLNGIIWLRGGDIDLATEAIFKVEREAHTSGLTESIKHYLESKVNAKTKSE
jgi:exosome complex component RRP4